MKKMVWYITFWPIFHFYDRIKIKILHWIRIFFTFFWILNHLQFKKSLSKTWKTIPFSWHIWVLNDKMPKMYTLLLDPKKWHFSTMVLKCFWPKHVCRLLYMSSGVPIPHAKFRSYISTCCIIMYILFIPFILDKMHKKKIKL